MIRWTSRLAYSQELIKLSGRRLQVYQAIRDWPHHIPGPSIADLAETTGLKECSVCGRVSELRKLNCIAEGPLKRNEDTGKSAMTYLAIGYQEQQPVPAYDHHGQALLL